LGQIILPPATTATGLLDQVELIRLEAAARLVPVRRSELGQFFTPALIARRMAAMLGRLPDHLEILDAGAGVGILSAACVDAALGAAPRPRSVQVTAYEIDPALHSYLEESLACCARACAGAEVAFSYTIHAADFVTAAVAQLNSAGGFFDADHPPFNCAVLNPPYRKINSASAARRLLRTAGIETSNLYTAFAWLVMRLLAPGGELVAITPRSFCNGPYFHPFRRALLAEMALQRIHVFESRTRAFQADDVLQENVIYHAVKTRRRPEAVQMTMSVGPEAALASARLVPYDQVVRPDDPNAFIHIELDDASRWLEAKIRGLGTALGQLGLSVSTGRVVEFRAREWLRPMPQVDTAPLVYPGHFAGGYVAWPKQKSRKPNALAVDSRSEGLLVPSGYYVLVKRLTSKEEPRRIVAAVFDPTSLHAGQVGFENHLNYFHLKGQGLPALLARGLAAYLNSSLVDRYFRRFNGHTQVNATDLRSLPYPSEAQLLALGTRIGKPFPPQTDLDAIVEAELGMAAEEAELGKA
jgi:adenine-specific DNA-methyltransferase